MGWQDVTKGPTNRTTLLSLVKSRPETPGQHAPDTAQAATMRDVDWSILMARAQDGDGSAYKRLLDEITPYLRSLARRRHRECSDVEDAVQDVLLTVHAIRATYDPARPFGPWLLTIANRRLVDSLRRHGRQKAREVALAPEHDGLAVDLPVADQSADYGKLELAVERLSNTQRQAIRLLKLKEMPLKEAAQQSGMSVASLKVATHRALASLRKMLTSGSET